MKVGKQEVAGESPSGIKAIGVLPCPAVTAWDPALRLTSLRNRDGESQVDVSRPTQLHGTQRLDSQASGSTWQGQEAKQDARS